VTVIADNLFERLDPEYQAGDEVLRVIFEAFSPKLQSAADAIEGLGANFDPATTPDTWLTWLLERTGWPVDDEWPTYTKRQILERVGGWRKRYGRPGVIEEIVHTYFTPSSTVAGLTVQLRVRGQTDGGYRVGRGYIGRARIWQRFSRNVLRVIVTSAGDLPYTADTSERLRRLLEGLIPPWMTFTIVSDAVLTVIFNPPPTPPDAPSNLIGTANSSTTIDLSWT
jgi:phage tail-like protein